MKFRQEETFYALQLSVRNVKLHPCTGAKRYKGRHFRGSYKVSLKEFCEALQINLL